MKLSFVFCLVFFLFSKGAIAAPIQVSDLVYDEQKKEFERLSKLPRYRMTLSLLKKERFEEALTAAKRLTNTMPHDYLSNLLIALAYIGTNDYLKVQEHLRNLPTDEENIKYWLTETVFNVYFSQQRYFYALQTIQRIDESKLTPNTLHNLGLIYMGQGHMLRAERVLSKALLNDASNRDIAVSLSRTLVIVGEYEKARSVLEALKKDVSHDAKVLQLLSSVYIALNKIDHAKRMYALLLEVNENDLLANLNLGVIGQIEQDKQASINYFAKAIEIDSSSADAYVGLILNSPDKNRKEQLSLIKSKNVQQDPIVNLLRLTLSHNSEAPFISTAATYFPDLPYSKENLPSLLSLDLVEISMLYRLGYYDQIIKKVESSPSKRSSLHQLVYARSLIKKGRDDSAKLIYRNIIDTGDGRAISARIELAEIAYRENDFQSAKSQYEQLVAKDNMRVDWKLQLSNIYLKLDKIEQALDVLNEAYSLSSDVLVLNQLSAIYSEFLNKHDKAIELAMKERDKFNKYPILLDTLGWAHYNKGEIADALNYYSLLLKKTGSKHTATSFFRMGLVYKEAGVLGAETLFELALNEGRDFAEFDQAKAYLGLSEKELTH